MTIAVLMSIYRQDKLHFVAEAVESLRQQEFAAFHVYVCFDGPVNPDIASYFHCLKDNRFTICPRPLNYGLAVSLNEMIELALSRKNYQYFARMDADDICDKNRFLRQVDFLDKNPEIDVVGTWCLEIDSNGREIFRKKMPQSPVQVRGHAIWRNPLVHPSVMIRRSVFSSGARYSRKFYLAEDYALWINLLSDGCKIANIPDFLLRFRLSGNFFSRRGGLRRAVSDAKIRGMAIKKLNLGVFYYVFAIGAFGVRLLPPQYLSAAYTILRR